MRRTQSVFATLSVVTVATVALVAGIASAADPPGPPTAAPPASPAPDGAKITKSRSNIQNNRQAAPPVKKTDATAEPKELVKTKTKSNQSND